MRTIVGTLLSTIILLTMGSALANAQNSNNNPASQSQVHELQQKVNAQGHRIIGTESAISALKSQIKAQQGNLGGQIAATNKQVTNQEVALETTQKAVIDLQRSSTDNDRRASTLSYVMIALTFVVVLAIVIGIAFGIRSFKKETILVNPDVMTLRALWKEKRRPIKFIVRLHANPEKGFMSGGDVSDYIATFDDSGGSTPIDTSFPKIEFRNEKGLRLDKLPQHAAKVLRLGRVSSSPISIQQTS
jgi:hypothetical protein